MKKQLNLCICFLTFLASCSVNEEIQKNHSIEKIQEEKSFLITWTKLKVE